MFDVGLLELFIVATIALVVLGPDKLPKAARSVGLMVGKFRRSLSSIQEDLERQARLEDLQEKLKDPQSMLMDSKIEPVDNKDEAELDLLDTQESQTKPEESPTVSSAPLEGNGSVSPTPKQIDEEKIIIQPVASKDHE